MIYLIHPSNRPPKYSLSEFFDVIEHIGLENILLVLVLLSFVIGIIATKKKLLNHWNGYIKGLSYSPLDFYSQLEQSLKEEEIPGLGFQLEKRKESGVSSGARYYARITWDEYTYSVCASPFAKSFFVSYRLLHRTNRLVSGIANIPWLGKRLVKWFAPISWYKEDKIQVFHGVVHECIVSLLQELAKEQGLERLSDRHLTAHSRNLFDRS